MYAWGPGRPEEDVGFPATAGCELSCRFWELNPCPLKEGPVLLTTEPSLQSTQLNCVIITYYGRWGYDHKIFS